MRDLVRSRRLSYAADAEEPARGGRRSSESSGRRINPTLSTRALSEARNALEAAHASGDYRHQSVGDLIRAALGAYGSGLRLTEQARRGRKKRHTVELPVEIIEVYENLPARSRGVIIERALLSLLARGFD